MTAQVSPPPAEQKETAFELVKNQTIAFVVIFIYWYYILLDRLCYPYAATRFRGLENGDFLPVPRHTYENLDVRAQYYSR